jgi:hypothetical protein
VKQIEAQIETFKQKVRDLKAQGDKEREIKSTKPQPQEI